MKCKTLFLLLSFTIIFLNIPGCTEDPGTTGYQAIPPEDIIGVKTFDTRLASSAVRTYSYLSQITHASSDLLSLGKANGYESSVLMRFVSLSDSNASGGKFLSVTVSWKPTAYVIGDKNASLTFQVKQIRSAWSSLSFTADSLSTIVTDAAAKGSFTGIVSDTNAIQFELDTTMVREWFVDFKNGNTSSILGVLLTPSTNNTTLRAFHSSEAISSWQRPVLTVVKDGNGKIDTFKVDVYEDTFVAAGPLPNSLAPFEVHSGLAHRGFLWFDVSAIPPHSTINNVQLELTLNRQTSQFYYRGVDSLLVQETVDSVKREIISPGALGLRKNGDVYSFTSIPLIRAVQQWVSRTNLNYGLTIRSVSEINDLDLYVLFDANADSLRRPRLIVTYSTAP